MRRIKIFYFHSKGSARRSGTGEPQADAARRSHQAPRKRPLYMDASGFESSAKGGKHSQGGNGRERSNRTADAGRAACGVMAGNRPLGRIWSADAENQG